MTLTDSDLQRAKELCEAHVTSKVEAEALALLQQLLDEVERLRAENVVLRDYIARAKSRISYLESLAGEGDE
jgi:hypothetical protein